MNMQSPYPLPCRWLHRWSAWEDLSDEPVKVHQEFGCPTVRTGGLTQERRCTKCGYADRRTVQS